jgi:hypothetical protein
MCKLFTSAGQSIVTLQTKKVERAKKAQAIKHKDVLLSSSPSATSCASNFFFALSTERGTLSHSDWCATH